MAKNNKADMSCARVKKYTAFDVSKAERHNERKNESYENMNVIEERIPYNVHFKKPFAPTYMMIFARNCWNWAFPKTKSPSSTTPRARCRRKICSAKCGAVRCVSCWAAPSAWAPAPTARKLIALHHLECPWRPSDLQQREGRIIRQGNENPEVDIYSYVTEGTFDAYLYQLVESKQKFISQIMTSKSPVRSAEDVDEQALSYAEIKALASGNPMIKEKMDLDIEVSKLKLLKANHLSQKYALEDAISKGFPKQIAETQARIAGYGADIAAVKENTHPNGDGFSPLTLAGVTHADKKEAGAALLTMCQTMLSPEATQIGSYRGLTLELAFDTFAREYRLTMIGQLRHTVTLGTDVFGNLQRMDNALEGLPIKEQTCREQLSNLQTQLETAKVEVQKPFPREAELNTKTARLEELNSLLNLDHKEPEIVDAEPDEDQRPPERRRPQLER